jgi:hypothetical protein
MAGFAIFCPVHVRRCRARFFGEDGAAGGRAPPDMSAPAAKRQKVLRQSTAAVSTASLQRAATAPRGGKHMPLEMLEARDRDLVRTVPTRARLRVL